jgi:hypothetical protein
LSEQEIKKEAMENKRPSKYSKIRREYQKSVLARCMTTNYPRLTKGTMWECFTKDGVVKKITFKLQSTWDNNEKS